MILGRLPVAVHPSWRAEMERRWSTARALLIMACVVVPAVLLATAVTVVVLVRASVLVAPLALAVSLGAWGVNMWYVRPEALRTRTDFWGTRSGFLCLVQVVAGIAPFSAGLPGSASWAVVLAGILLGLVGGVLGYRAHSTLLSSRDAVAATSFALKHPLYIPESTYRGEAVIHGDHLTWCLYRVPGNAGWIKTSYSEDRIRLDEVAHAEVAEVRDPYRVPPVLVDPGGNPVPPPRGTVTRIRTRTREVVLPAAAPHQLVDDLHRRLRTPPWGSAVPRA